MASKNNSMAPKNPMKRYLTLGHYAPLSNTTEPNSTTFTWTQDNQTVLGFGLTDDGVLQNVQETPAQKWLGLWDRMKIESINGQTNYRPILEAWDGMSVLLVQLAKNSRACPWDFIDNDCKRWRQREECLLKEVNMLKRLYSKKHRGDDLMAFYDWPDIQTFMDSKILSIDSWIAKMPKQIFVYCWTVQESNTRPTKRRKVTNFNQDEEMLVQATPVREETPEGELTVTVKSIQTRG
ncbi:hypothetical protein AaE_004796 [Aphanomyces astaci]|uniref:Uncharacterized protein n=1 Tax=Aphanomyces astaci TaxID=112090 RepID=A0A6A5AQR3_APHAT|nr:hypothetical protein AaE_004796 [Aphanomyces astaci]